MLAPGEVPSVENGPARPLPTTATSQRPISTAAAAFNTPRTPAVSRWWLSTQASGCCRYIAQFSASRGAPPGPGQSIAAPSTSRGVKPASAIAPLTASMTMSCEVRPGSVRACLV